MTPNSFKVVSLRLSRFIIVLPVIKIHPFFQMSIPLYHYGMLHYIVISNQCKNDNDVLHNTG